MQCPFIEGDVISDQSYLLAKGSQDTSCQNCKSLFDLDTRSILEEFFFQEYCLEYTNTPTPKPEPEVVVEPEPVEEEVEEEIVEQPVEEETEETEPVVEPETEEEDTVEVKEDNTQDEIEDEKKDVYIDPKTFEPPDPV